MLYLYVYIYLGFFVALLRRWLRTVMTVYVIKVDVGISMAERDFDRIKKLMIILIPMLIILR